MEEGFWIILCCCCCCCCILPTAILVPLAIAGVFAGQPASVVEVVDASAVNLTVTTASPLEEVITTSAVDTIPTLPSSWRPFGPADVATANMAGDERNSSLCGDDEILIYDWNSTDENSTDENSTNATRCEKKPQQKPKKSRKWIVRITNIEVVFNWMGEISYYTSIGALICGATQIGLAAISALFAILSCPSALSQVMFVLEAIVGTFFGLIYIGYLITVPLFGLPEGNFFYPELPHVGPPPPNEVQDLGYERDKFIAKTIFAVRNSIFLAFVLYLLMMSIMVILGSVIVIPSVCFFMGILVGLTRLADSVVRMLAKDLDDEFEKETKDKEKEEARKEQLAAALAAESADKGDNFDDVKQQAEKAGDKVMNALNGEGNVAEDTNQTLKDLTGLANLQQRVEDTQDMAEKAKGMLEQKGGPITIPWWDKVTKDYFQEMESPSRTCIKMASFQVGCKDFCFNIFSFLAEFAESLVSVGIPSFVKFNFDILFLLTVLGSFSITMPSFKFDLPDVDLGISALIPAFRLFDINLPSLPPTYIPEWQGHCQATTGLGLILNLIGSTFTATVVISSDILSCLYDRQSRIKLLKAAQRQKEKADEKDQQNKEKDTRSCLQKMKDKISDLRIWIRAVRASIYTGLVEVSTFAVLFSIGLIVNQATVFLVRLILEIGAPNSNDGQVPPGWPPCTVGVFGLSKILAVVAVLATLSYAYRVLSGHVHKDGIYILGGALVQEEKIFQLVSLKRLVAIVRVCSFALLLPFLSLGLRYEHMDQIKGDLGGRRGSLDKAVKRTETGELNESKIKEVAEEVVDNATRLTQIQKGSSKNITSVKRKFAARSAMTSSLFDLALNERGQETQMLLQRNKGHSDLRRVDDFHLFEFTECCQTMAEKRTTWYGPFLAMLGAPFGRMSNSDAIANRMAERCCIWQAQAESVHKASSYIHGIVLFLIPIGGTVAGKGLQVMSDSPGLFTAEEKEICEYSFYQEKSEVGGSQILPSVWRRASYFLGILRVVCSILTISLRSTDVFWAMSSTNSFLAASQATLQKLDDRENKKKIADKLKGGDDASNMENQAAGRSQPSPQKFGGEQEDQDDVENQNGGQFEQDEQEANANRSPRQSLQEEDGGNRQDEAPQFDFQSDGESPSPKPSKAKTKGKKSKVSKVKGKAKAKAKAEERNDDEEF